MSLLQIIGVGVLSGLIVSIPPGANTALILGHRQTTWPLRNILLIAGYDTLWALVGASGVLAAQQAALPQSAVWFASGILLWSAAWLLRPRSTPPSTKVAVLLVAGNVPAIMLWLAVGVQLPSGLIHHPCNIALFAVAAGAGTWLWFTLIAGLGRLLRATTVEVWQQRMDYLLCGCLLLGGVVCFVLAAK